MARQRYLSLIPTLGLVVLTGPAAAQFGSIFGPPPRPPADVPGASYPVQQADPRLPVEPRYERPLPPQPPPPPLTRFPSGAPGGVQSQPLPPPPGTVPAPPGLPPPPGTAAVPSGLPPPPPPGAPQDFASRPPGSSGQPPLPGLPPGQRQPRGTPQPANTGPQPGDEIVVQPPSQKIVNPTAVFAGLDKITGRIISFDVAIDETVQFGALRLTPRACYTRPATETPNTDGFIEVDEITLQGEVKRIFTGWMFAASPGLHGIEHSIYDVWLTDCKRDQPQTAQAQQTEQTPPAQPASATPSTSQPQSAPASQAQTGSAPQQPAAPARQNQQRTERKQTRPPAQAAGRERTPQSAGSPSRDSQAQPTRP